MSKAIKIFEAVMVGGFISSMFVMNTDDWKICLSVILLIHSLDFYLKD